MFLLRLSGRPQRPVASLRTRLSVEFLADRAAPSSLADSGDDSLDAAALDASLNYAVAQPSSPVPSPIEKELPTRDAPPEIVDFVVVQIGPGLYQISGRVIDETPAGLVVTFGGVPSAEGVTATANSDGYFEMTLELNTDGSDSGLLTAVTRDAAGQESNIAAYYVNPA